MEDTITMLYTSNGLIFGAAFLPQILALIKDKSGSVSVNLATWGLFSLCSLVTMAYACLHNGDSHFIFCSCVAMIGNVSVLSLGAMRRLQYATASKRDMRTTR
jgi:lipid-A-disaccharide synthase-like uncharacterized protein